MELTVEDKQQILIILHKQYIENLNHINNQATIDINLMKENEFIAKLLNNQQEFIYGGN